MGNRRFRSKLGRFVKGCKPGPGRPRVLPPRPPIEPADELVVEAIAMVAAFDGWRFCLARFDLDVCKELADRSHASGWHVPLFVREALAWSPPPGVVRRRRRHSPDARTR